MKYFLAMALIATSVFANSQTKNHLDGRIKGTVTDQGGSPVVGATVYAVPQFLTFDGIKPRSVKTDRNGGFDFGRGLPLGAYKLYSQKDEDGYPDPFNSLDAEAKVEVAKVVLTKRHRSATAKVTLGKKSGVVTGQVIDADSGAATKAFLVFIDQDGNRREIVADGSFRVSLPPGKDIILMVTAMSGQSSTRRPFDTPVRLEPGQEIYMDIPVSNQ
jgi:Carboxypeptidase regulatory-like domain